MIETIKNLPTDLEKISWSNWCDYVNFKNNYKLDKTYEYYHKCIVLLTDVVLEIDLDSSVKSQSIEALKMYLKALNNTTLNLKSEIVINANNFITTDFNLTILEGFMTLQFMKQFNDDLFSKSVFIFSLLNRKENESLIYDIHKLKEFVKQRANIVQHCNAYDMICFYNYVDAFINMRLGEYKHIYKSIYIKEQTKSEFAQKQQDRYQRFSNKFGYYGHLKKFVDNPTINLNQSFEYGLWWLEMELNQL